jgi:hypothetical protein
MYGYEEQLHLPFAAYQKELRQLLKLTHKRYISRNSKEIFRRLSTRDRTGTTDIPIYTENNSQVSPYEMEMD